MTKVIVLIGAGSIGVAIVRRVSAGKHILLADLRLENAEAAAKPCSTLASRLPRPASMSPHVHPSKP